jgi:hypothetical protein
LCYFQLQEKLGLFQLKVLLSETAGYLEVLCCLQASILNTVTISALERLLPRILNSPWALSRSQLNVTAAAAAACAAAASFPPTADELCSLNDCRFIALSLQLPQNERAVREVMRCVRAICATASARVDPRKAIRRHGGLHTLMRCVNQAAQSSAAESAAFGIVATRTLAAVVDGNRESQDLVTTGEAPLLECFMS